MKNWILGILLFSLSRVCAQPDIPFYQNDSTKNTWLQFSLKDDLLNMSVESSKEASLSTITQITETSFFSPFSVSVISKTDLLRAGINTIPEALRLAVGFVVRQKTNGVFGVQNRNHILPNQALLEDYDTPNFLLLIDNMPMNQYFVGQIFWEALPISLQDIERIEINRSPSTIVYGQNATATIHIITQKAEEKQVRVNSQVQAGSFESYQAHLSAKWGITEKLSLRLSGNYRTNNRFDQRYYLLGLGRSTSSDSLLFFENNVSQTHLFTQSAQQSYQVSTKINYQFSEKTNLQASVFTQNSQIQAVLHEAGNFAQNTRQVQQNILNLNFKSPHWVFDFSYLFGNQNLAKGYNGFRFDQHSLNGRAYYQIERQEWRLMAGAAYQQHGFNEAPYLSPNDSAFSNSLDQKVNMAHIGAFAQVDWQINTRLRMLGGLRNEFYLEQNQTYLNFSLNLSYRLRENWLFRANYGSSSLNFSLQDLYSKQSLRFVDLRNPNRTIRQENLPNSSLILPKNHILELGIRAVLFRNWQFDVEAFQAISQNAFQNRLGTNGGQVLNMSRINSSETIKNTGISLSLAFRNQNVQIKAFGTYQSNTHISSFQNPHFVGGVDFNYSILFGKLNANALLYHTSEQTMQNFYHSPVIIPAQNIVNTKVSYKFWKEQIFYFSAQNLLNQTQAEFIFGESSPTNYQVGLLLTY